VHSRNVTSIPWKGPNQWLLSEEAAEIARFKKDRSRVRKQDMVKPDQSFGMFMNMYLSEQVLIVSSETGDVCENKQKKRIINRILREKR
jgi:hypothetical protein